MSGQSAAFLGDAKGLGRGTLLYGFGTFFLKGLQFLLLPVYTRYLSPEEYGIIATGLTLTAVLSIIFPMGLHGSLTRLYFNDAAENERGNVVATLAAAILGSATVMAALLDLLAGPLFTSFLRAVPFNPYVRLSIWTSFFGMFGLLPQTLLQVREKPGLYVLTTVVGTLLLHGSSLALVVLARKGAYGYLWGPLGAAAVMAVPYVMITVRYSRLPIRWDTLRQALAYGLPLIPHSLCAWLMAFSDRFILERYLSIRVVGLYLLSFQFGTALSLISGAATSAWVPFLFRVHSERGDESKSMLARFTTYYAAVMAWISLGVALLAKPVIMLVCAPDYHPASRIVPWIVCGAFFNALYYIPVNFLFLKSRTGWLATATLAAGVLSVCSNLALIPRFGAAAAAGSGVACNAFLLMSVWAAARMVFPFPYEYRRLVHLTTVGLALALVGLVVPVDGVVLETVVRASLWLLFPVALFLTGFCTSGEVSLLRALVRSAGSGAKTES